VEKLLEKTTLKEICQDATYLVSSLGVLKKRSNPGSHLSPNGHCVTWKEGGSNRGKGKKISKG